jgi:glycerol-1-phosphate dehydrogenase [NAD(P)+]
MDMPQPIYIGNDALSELVRYCAGRQLRQLTLVADQNTYAALGQAAEGALKPQGFDVKTIMLTGEEIIADARYIFQVLVEADRRNSVYLAVGSGTITDIVRFVSHRTMTSFISVPTAPSVDGYTSIGAPLVIGGQKITLVTQAPVAVFADLPTLCRAPQRMIASGFGDMIGKFTSIADWRLGTLLWNEPYSAPIAQRSWQAAQNSRQCAEQIGRADMNGVRCLFEGLIESGLCMMEYGNTQPASGSEHHMAHFWEMKLLQENRPAILHGAKVGVACVMVAGYYDQIKQLSRAEAARRLESTPMPGRQQEIERIKAAYGPVADHVIAGNPAFLDMSPAVYRQLKECILEHWADIQEIARQVPSAQQVADMLRLAGGPARPEQLGLGGDREAASALQVAHYYRNRFTVIKLSRMLGIH